MRGATTFTSLVALIVGGFVVTACGCSTLNAPSSLEKQILEPPSASFMKRVKNDPFPSASEQTYTPPKEK